MKNLNKNQWIAVFVSLALLGYILFTGPIMNFLNSPVGNPQSQASAPEISFSMEEVVVGTGSIAESGDTLSVHYVGTLTDGKVFDSSVDRNVPFSFTLGVGQVIRGWDEGLIGMRVGGKRLLTVPPEYGYGDQGVGAIPPNSTLIFAVELLDDQKPSSR